MKITANAARISVATVVILGTVAWLAMTGYSSNKSYYLKIGEVLQPNTQSLMGNKIHDSQLRVEGFVVPGSIKQDGTHVAFTMNEFESHNPSAATGKTIQVDYKGSEPPPDAFKDDSMTVATGTYGYDGKVHASALQAKCASKYAPAGPNQPGPNQPGAKPAVPPYAPKSTASAATGTAKPAA